MERVDVLRQLKLGQRVAEEEGAHLSEYFVETDPWRKLFADEVDITYGPKGSGKSALYSLLNARRDALAERGVLLSTAENPRGAPAFAGLSGDEPASEIEFLGLWKLYFVCLISAALEEQGVGGPHALRLRRALENEGLVRGERSLAGLLRRVARYVRGAVPEVQGKIEIDPHTQLPRGFVGKIAFREPDATGERSGVASVDELLRCGSEALATAGRRLWLLLDRLDVAFADSPELEQNALRALFKAYLDLAGHGELRLKIFLRSDIWRRITAEGFREASHVTRHMTIEWSRNALLHLVVRRLAANEALLDYYSASRDAVLQSTASQEAFFYSMMPEQVDVGPNKPATFDWMLGRTRDGSGQNAPRELIHLLNALRDQQIRRFEIGEAPPDDGRLFARPAFRDALPEVSRARLEQTLYAEYPHLRPACEQLRGRRTMHNAGSLARIWDVDEAAAVCTARQLAGAGFFEERGEARAPQFRIPFVFRDALGLELGAADEVQQGEAGA